MKQKVDAEFSRLTDPETLRSTVDALVDEGAIGAADARRLKAALPGQIERSQYCLRHLSAHLAIGVIFAFDAIPLPLGTMSRVGWVVGARIWETVRRSPNARIHSWRVLLVAAIPLFGYVAYTVPLRRHGRELLFVLANRIWLDQRGCSFEQFLSRRGPRLSRFGRWLVPLAGQRDA